MRTSAAFRFVILTASMLGALTAGDKKSSDKTKDASKAQNAAPPSNELTWPLPPDPPRVRWLAQYTDMTKVKAPVVKKASWVDKVTGTKTPDEKFEIRKPYGVTADSHGKIYVADTELKFIFVIDPAAKNVEKREGNSRAPLSLPAGVALDAEDRLFVSDADLHTIICFSPTGKPLATFGGTRLGRPGGIAIDRLRNRLYVADAKNSRIAVFDTATMQFVAYFGTPSKPGANPGGTFYAPTNVAVDRQGNVYVADTWNYRVQILDANGKFIRMFGAQGDRPGEFIRPKGIAVDSEGHIYVADAEFNNFQILSSDGKPLLAVGSLGTDPGQFALVAGLFIDAQDRIYTTEMFHGRVQVFQYIPQPDAADHKEVKRAANN